MSMSLCLEFTQKWLRESYNWKVNECAVTFNSLPAYNSGNFFVGIDDAGVEPGPQSTDSLKEICVINIGIWVRKEFLMKDQIGFLQLPKNPYANNNWTLYQLERKCILPNLYGLHQNWKYMAALNEFYSLPNNDFGADFRFTFYYRGRSGMLTQVLDTANSPEVVFYGYLLRFAGLAREQIIHNPSYCLG